MNPNYSIEEIGPLDTLFISCCNYAPINKVVLYHYYYRDNIPQDINLVAIFKVKMKDKVALRKQIINEVFQIEKDSMEIRKNEFMKDIN